MVMTELDSEIGKDQFGRMPDTEWPYGYRPSTAAAVTGLILFLAVLICHIFFYFKHRSYFFLFLIFGLCLQILAMFLRIPVGEQVAAGFVAASWAPSIIMAGIHMILGRLIWFITPHSRLNWRLTGLPPRFIGLIFVALDVFALVIDVLGSPSVFGNDDDPSNSFHTTSHTMGFGLVVQAVVLVLCIAVSTILGMKGKRWSALSTWKTEPNVRPEWQRLLLVVIVANALVLLRTAFAIIEAFTLASSSPNSVLSYLLDHEWTFWVFDFVPVFAACVLLLVFHPGQYIPRRFTGFRLRKRQLRAEKEQIEYGNPPTEYDQRPATLFKDTEKTPARAYYLPSKVPKAYYREEREHPAFG